MLLFFRRAAGRTRWHEGTIQGECKSGTRRARSDLVNRKAQERELEGRKERERERRRTSGPKRGPRRATQHNKSRGWWRTAGQMHFTTRSAATMEPTSWYHPVTPVDSTLRGLTPDYVQLDARRAPSASSELISVISRSCNLSRLLHGQLIIIAIPISGAIR